MRMRYEMLSILLAVGVLATAPAQAADVQEAGSVMLSGEALAVGSNAADSAGDRHHQWKGHDRECGDHHGPSLSDEQLEKINTLKEAARQSTAAQKTELHALSSRMHDLMTKPDVDRAEVMALQAKVNSLRSDLSNRWLNFRLDSMAVLTPEQKQQVRHRFLMHQMFGGFRHHGHCGGGGR